MITLTPYTEEMKSPLISWIADFYGFHAALLRGESEITEKEYIEAEKTLRTWLQPAHEVFGIQLRQTLVGFLHIGYRGETVAWIEDLYVAKPFREQGIATEAIHLTETIVQSRPGYTAICFDVVPRNEAALRLYHRLGYDCLSLLTVRKELYASDRDKTETLLGLEFRY